jgi:putative ATPase
VILAIDEALADVRAGLGGTVPRHLRDSHYAGSRGLGHGAGYRYPHDDPRGVVPQRYAPDDVAAREYYRPSGHGAERPLAERLAKLRSVVRSAAEPSELGASEHRASGHGASEREASGRRPLEHGPSEQRAEEG